MLDLGEGETDLARRSSMRHLVAGHVELGGVQSHNVERPEGAGRLQVLLVIVSEKKVIFYRNCTTSC